MFYRERFLFNCFIKSALCASDMKFLVCVSVLDSSNQTAYWTNNTQQKQKLRQIVSFPFLVKSQCESIYWISDIRSLVRGRGRGCGDNTVIICRSISTEFLFIVKIKKKQVSAFDYKIKLFSATYTQMNPVTLVCMISSSPDSAILIEIKWCRSCKPRKETRCYCQTEVTEKKPESVLTWLNGN